MYTPEQIRQCISWLAGNFRVTADGKYRECADILAATLKAAQGGVTEAMVEDLRKALDAANKPLLTDKAEQRAAWLAVSFMQDHGAALEAALSAQQGQVGVGVDVTSDGAHVCVRMGNTVIHSQFYPAPPAQQGEVVAWRFKLDDGSFQYGTAGHEVRIPRPIVEATPLYTTPPAQQGQGAAWDARGGSLWLDREQWGVVIDALIEHRASAAKRKNGNPDSTSDVRADECGDLIGKITSAAKSITTPPAQPAERVPEESYRGVPYRVLGKAFQRVLADPNVLWRDNGGAQEFIDRVQEETRLSLLASPAPSPARGDGGEG